MIATLSEVRRMPEGVREVVHGDLAAFEDSAAAPGVHTVWSGQLPLDFKIVRGTVPVLVVVFDGALNRQTTRLPRFSGFGVTQGLGVSRLAFSDPSLYLSKRLRLGWYAGNLHQPMLQEVIGRVVAKVIASLDVERVVFFGVSGGGFASLYYSSHVPGSLALAINPQTMLAAYRPAKTWQEVAWDGAPLGQLPLSVTTDLVAHYRAAKPTNYVAYVQNLSDSHVERHMKPWLSVCDPAKTQVQLGDWGEGHVAPPKRTIAKILADATQWSEGSTLPDFAVA